VADELGLHNLDEQWTDGLPDDAFNSAFLWAFAMERQHRRLNESDDAESGDLADALLYVISLRNVLRAAYFVDEVIGSGDQGFSIYWIRDFERRCPDVIAARNMLEHFNEYAMGRGRLQKGPGQEPLRIALGRADNGERVLMLRTGSSLLTIDLKEATAAAGELVVGLMMAHDQWEESLDEFEEWTRAAEARRRAGIPALRTRRTRHRPGEIQDKEPYPENKR
jgi:hypothetical protein